MRSTTTDAAEASVTLAHWKTQFLADLSYEVRTPLTGITGMADLLLETQLNAEQRDYVMTARACAEDLLATLDNALYLARLALDTAAISCQPFALRETLQAAIPAALEAAPSEVQIATHLSHDLPEVAIGDAARTGKLLSEMVQCATRAYGHGHVSLTVSPERDGGRLRLVLGCRAMPGPPPERPSVGATGQDKPAAAETGPMGGGVWLGWSLVHELTRRLGGSLWFSSEAQGGCQCKCVIPLGLPGEEEQDGALAGAAATQKAILLVEDNEIARRVVVHILGRRRPEYAVDCATSGLEALERAAARRYDLVLMDLQLPGIDGFETARRLSNLPGYSGVPVLALTANVTPEYREFCLRQGMAGFIAKPVQAAELLTALDEAFER